MARIFRLEELASLTGGRVQASPAVEISSAAGLDGVQAGGITFVEQVEQMARAEATPAAAVVAPEGARSDRPLLLVREPRVAFARILRAFHPRPAVQPGVHPTARVAAGVRTAGCRVGPYSCVGAGVKLGEGVELGPGVVIGGGCSLGEGTRIEARAVLEPGCSLGRECHLFPCVVVGRSGRLGDRVDLGARTVLGEGCELGEGCKLDNMVVLEADCRLGRHCLVVAQSCLGRGCQLEDYAVVAGQAAVAPGVRLPTGTVLAARGHAADSPERGDTLSGDPARPIKEDFALTALRPKALKLQARVRDRQPEPRSVLRHEPTR